MSNLSFQPRFGSDAAQTTANLIRYYRAQAKQEREAKQHEAELRQKILQELQPMDRFQTSIRPAQPRMQPSPIRFGILGKLFGTA